MAVNFVEAAGVWEVQGLPRKCAQCGQPGAMFSYEAEYFDALKGPHTLAFCHPWCWGKYAEARVVVIERSEGVQYIPDDAVPPWEEVAVLFPAEGPRGISTMRRGRRDVLLYRNAEGRLMGVLFHTPTHGRGGRQPGPITTITDPEFRGQRVATKLTREAGRRWGINLAVQQSTEAGYGQERKSFNPTPPP